MSQNKHRKNVSLEYAPGSTAVIADNIAVEILEATDDFAGVRITGPGHMVVETAEVGPDFVPGQSLKYSLTQKTEVSSLRLSVPETRIRIGEATGEIRIRFQQSAEGIKAFINVPKSTPVFRRRLARGQHLYDL